jgi:hypothetical protein
MIKHGREHPSNPAVVWLGYNPTDTRPPVSWNYMLDIDVRSIVSKGLNPAWNEKLEHVAKWNFFHFVKQCRCAYKNEYDRRGELRDERKLIIGIMHRERPAEVQMIDGSHRLASMILDGATTVDGYVGVRRIEEERGRF